VNGELPDYFRALESVKNQFVALIPIGAGNGLVIHGGTEPPVGWFPSNSLKGGYVVWVWSADEYPPKDDEVERIISNIPMTSWKNSSVRIEAQSTPVLIPAVEKGSNPENLFKLGLQPGVFIVDVAEYRGDPIQLLLVRINSTSL
jgi:hypothetical protein